MRTKMTDTKYDNDTRPVKHIIRTVIDPRKRTDDIKYIRDCDDCIHSQTDTCHRVKCIPEN